MDDRVCVLMALGMLKDSLAACRNLNAKLPDPRTYDRAASTMTGEHLLRNCAELKENEMVSLLRWIENIRCRKPEIQEYLSWYVVLEARDYLSSLRANRGAIYDG